MFIPAKNHKGFSIIEVIFALAMLGIMVGIASISFLNFSPKYRLKKAVWEINSCLNYARYKAIFDGTKFRVKLERTSYTVERYSEVQKEWTRERKHFLQGVTLKANNSPTFHPKGIVSNLASILISNSWGKYKITLAISGRIKIIKL